MKKIHVTIIGPDVSSMAGGVVTATDCILEGFKGNEWFEVSSYPSVREGSSGFKTLYSLFRVLKFFTQIHNYDIVHIQLSSYRSTWRKYLYYQIANMANIPVVIHVHGGEYKDFYTGLSSLGKKCIRGMFKGSSQVLALSEGWQKVLQETIHLENVAVVGNGVDCNFFSFNSGIEGEMSFVGNLTQEKGLYVLVSALKDMPLDLEWHLNIAGSGDIADLNRILYDMGIDSRVSVLGSLSKDNVRKLLRDSQIFILPSFKEGVPYSILEAMSCGNLIVSTPVGGIPELADESPGVFLVPVGDAEQLSNALIRLLRSKEKSRLMLKNKECVAAGHSSQSVIEKLSDIYRKLVSD